MRVKTISTRILHLLWKSLTTRIVEYEADSVLETPFDFVAFASWPQAM